MNLETYTDRELADELKRRKAAEKLAKSFPVQIDDDSKLNRGLIELAASYLEDAKKGYEPDERYAYEWVMTTVYGNEIFNTIDKL